jgi:hypothetical protein
MAPTASRDLSLRCLQAATALVFAYMCAGELLPLPALRVAKKRVLRDWWGWQTSKPVFLVILCSRHAQLIVKPAWPRDHSDTPGRE